MCQTLYMRHLASLLPDPPRLPLLGTKGANVAFILIVHCFYSLDKKKGQGHTNLKNIFDDKLAKARPSTTPMPYHFNNSIQFSSSKPTLKQDHTMRSASNGACRTQKNYVLFSVYLALNLLHSKFRI